MSTHKVDETIGSVLSFLALNATSRTKVTGIIRARLSRGSDVTKAARIRSAIKRLTDAFKWNGIEEDDYRQQLRELQAELALCERVPDERRMLEAMRIADAHCPRHPTCLEACFGRTASADDVERLRADHDFRRRSRFCRTAA